MMHVLLIVVGVATFAMSAGMTQTTNGLGIVGLGLAFAGLLTASRGT